jgi:hypothetical protein
MRSGTATPSRSAASSAPCARSSLQKKIASTGRFSSRICSSICPPSASDDGAGFSHSSVASYAPASFSSRRQPSRRCIVRGSSWAAANAMRRRPRDSRWRVNAAAASACEKPTL